MIVITSLLLVICVDAVPTPLPPSSADIPCPPVVNQTTWGARPPIRVVQLTVPAPFVVIHHTYIPGACNVTTACQQSMRNMQAYHQSKGWNDIGYNFAIGGDLQVYAGRGWDVVGAHSPKYNGMSIGIVFIGDYRYELPSEGMLSLAHQLVACAVARGSLSTDYRLVGHRQVRDTECPGDALFTHVQTWPHWANMTDIVPRDTAKAAESTTVTTEDSNVNTVND